MATLTGLSRLKLRDPWRWTLRLGFGVLLAGAAIYFLVRQVDWRTAFAYVRQVSLFWLLLGALSVLANGLAKSSRWRLLFPPDPAIPSRRKVFGVLMGGQLLNLLLPFRSGDISRAYFMGRYRGASTLAAAGTIGAEKIVDLTVLGLLIMVVLPLVVLPGSLLAAQGGAEISAAVGLVVWAGILLMLPVLQRWLITLGEHVPTLSVLGNMLARLLDGLHGLRSRQRLPSILMWSAAVWVTAVLTNLILFRALNMPTSLLSAVLVVLIIQGGVSVPIAPGQIGVFEALAVFALSLTGVPAEQALAFGILLHIIVIVVPLAVGFPWLWRHIK